MWALVERLNSNRLPIRAEFLQWHTVGTFLQQLRMLAELDVYVSGPGTSLMFSHFMRPGSTVINVGDCFIQWSMTRARPWYMEQYMCEGATDYQKCLYLPNRTRCSNKNLNGTQLEALILQAYENRAVLSAQAGDNLSVEGRVFMEYCRQEGLACNSVVTYLNSFQEKYLELFVYEEDIFDPTRNVPGINRTRLHELKRRYAEQLQQ